MILKLGLNSSPKNYIDKTVEYAADKDGTLKEGTSVVNPTFLVAGISHLFSDYNYMYVPDFHRRYFITEIVSVRKGLVEISGHCDVLSSVGDTVKAQPCIISETQHGWNRKINDGSFKVYQDRYIINDFKFPNSFEAPGDYVLALAGS